MSKINSQSPALTEAQQSLIMDAYFYCHGLTPLGAEKGELLWDHRDIERIFELREACVPIKEIRKLNSKGKRDLAQFRRGLIPSGRDMQGHFIWNAKPNHTPSN